MVDQSLFHRQTIGDLIRHRREKRQKRSNRRSSGLARTPFRQDQQSSARAIQLNLSPSSEGTRSAARSVPGRACAASKSRPSKAVRLAYLRICEKGGPKSQTILGLAFGLEIAERRSEPSAKDIRCLIGTAIRRHGTPRYLVSDRGRQFTARLLGRWLRSRGIRQRFGAIGKTGSIAIIERFWRTIKDLLGLPFAPPFLRSELERRLDATVTYYAELKPHHGLAGDTPSDRYCERETTSRNLRSPPRARLGEKSPPVPFRVAYFRRNPRLPYLVPHAA